MKIISEEKQIEKAWNISKQASDKFGNLGTLVSNLIGVESGRCFSSGVDFAETELQNLAIEFAEFCNGNFYVIDEDVFTKFLEQRNK